MRTIEEVLNEMIGANYAVTAAQICEVMEIHSAEVAAVNIRIRAAYEEGRKHDKAELEKILGGEKEKKVAEEWSCETCEHSGSGNDCWSQKECIQGSEWSQRNLNPFLKSTLGENGIRIPKDATDTNIGKTQLSEKDATDAIYRKDAIEVAKAYWYKPDIAQALAELPPAQSPPISEAYAKAVRNWLVNYQVKLSELDGRYTPYEVLGWVVSDWRKENGIW